MVPRSVDPRRATLLDFFEVAGFAYGDMETDFLRKPASFHVSDPFTIGETHSYRDLNKVISVDCAAGGRLRAISFGAEPIQRDRIILEIGRNARFLGKKKMTSS